ncbi:MULTISPECIES: hypothetical protein [Streptomyces]|jgi:hypothetical protein|uniref:Uncharacterized protein n=3 Tax=Streptomyces griseoaurantiacus TaxID=68213 RepID=F3NCD3_9ACTN|nr:MULTISPECIES: hypothetical protein [Streptomyces]EGG49021.1 hypothetical protein SGM_6822 [Streptomyces griseoaurantiacus M045]MBA5219934.1 hypothetical protein [Streptomyces griseoaurantiacus]MCF0086121.1 hypothetical protein [Streptomyces sp. MH192]MCF0101321.1 hypothetical protein [Streptomyces sp. MH191]MDX3091072.1 hypothetical protein [Streptomyces sp. ME12-02E]
MCDRSPVTRPVRHDHVPRCAEELRAALALHGLTLPSLGVDLLVYAGTYAPPAGLVALGNCNTATARALTAVLRKAAEG